MKTTAAALLFCVAAGIWAVPSRAQSAAELEPQVAAIFAQSCARVGCHAGSDPQMGMSLETDMFFAHTVDQSSRERPDLRLIAPGRPDSSYLLKKVRGEPDIIGAQMPLTGNKLSGDQIATIEKWVTALAGTDVTSRTENAPAKTVSAFDGWRVVNLPTTRMVDAKTWLFLISHRFNPKLGSGYESLYGLDGSGIIFLSLGYAPSENILFTLGRSNASDDVEMDGRIRLMQETVDGRTPVSLGARAAVNWITEKVGDKKRLRSEAFKFSGQVMLSRAFTQRFGVLVVPGILFNPDENKDGEGALATVGLGGRWRFHRNMSLVAEWVPIIAGYTRTRTFGNDNRFDSWGGGLEISIGGHVFQIVLTNSVGLTSDQYMRGGDLDIRKPDLRLGFNIFRLLRF